MRVARKHDGIDSGELRKRLLDARPHHLVRDCITHDGEAASEAELADERSFASAQVVLDRNRCDIDAGRRAAVGIDPLAAQQLRERIAR